MHNFFFSFRLLGEPLGIISSQHHHQLIHYSTRWCGILDGQSGCIRKSPRDGLATYRVLCTASMSSRRRISVDPMPFLEQRIMFGICPLFLMASSARCSSMFSVIRKTELFLYRKYYIIRNSTAMKSHFNVYQYEPQEYS